MTPATDGAQPEREQGETHHRRIGVHIFSLRELPALTLGQYIGMMLVMGMTKPQTAELWLCQYELSDLVSGKLESCCAGKSVGPGRLRLDGKLSILLRQ